MARPLAFEIQWNRRTTYLDQIVQELDQERPVLLKIRGIPDEHRIQASQEMKRTKLWNDVHTAEYYQADRPKLVDPRRDGEKTFSYSDGAESNPVLAGLQSQSVRAREVTSSIGEWMHFSSAQEAAEQLEISDGDGFSPLLVIQCCEINQSIKLNPGVRAAPQESRGGDSITSLDGRTYEFEYSDADKNALEIWYGICRSLALLPESETGINMIGTVVRSTTRRWKKMPAAPVFYHETLAEKSSDQRDAKEKLCEEIKKQYKRGNQVIKFDANEWKNIGIRHLQTNHYVHMDGDNFQPTGAYTTKAHWHAPPVINVHLYGSAYKTYELKRFEKLTGCEVKQGEGYNFDETQWRPEFTCTVGSHSECHGNALIFPGAMLHRVITHSHAKLKLPRSQREVDNLTMVYPELNKYTENIQRILKLRSIQDKESLDVDSLYNQYWKPILANIPGACAAMHASLEENLDRRFYLGISTYAIISASVKDGPDAIKLFAYKILDKIRSYRKHQHWANQINATHRTKILGPVRLEDPFPDELPVHYAVRTFASGKMQNSKIVTVHHDDPHGPYYTVQREDGSFFQTTHGRLRILKLVEEEDGRLGAMWEVFRRQSVIDIDRILNARFPEGLISFADGVDKDDDSVVSTVVSTVVAAAHAAPAAAQPPVPTPTSASKQPVQPVPKRSTSSSTQPAPVPKRAASSSTQPAQPVPSRSGGPSRSTQPAQPVRPAQPSPAPKRKLAPQEAPSKKRASSAASSSSTGARSFKSADFDIALMHFVSVTYENVTKPVKITSPAFEEVTQPDEEMSFDDFVNRIKLVIESITDGEILAKARIATRQQIDTELCANKTHYKDFLKLTGHKGAFKFADAWKYLRAPKSSNETDR